MYNLKHKGTIIFYHDIRLPVTATSNNICFLFNFVRKYKFYYILNFYVYCIVYIILRLFFMYIHIFLNNNFSI